MKILSLLNDGGPVFTYPIFALLIVVIVLIVKGFVGKGDQKKTCSLLSSIGALTLAWGFVGLLIGLIGAFDAIEAVDGVSMGIMAGGLKVSLLSPLFGLIVFSIARLGIIGLILKTKKEH